METRASPPLPGDSGPLPSGGRRAKAGGCESCPCPLPGSGGQLRSAGRGPKTRGAERGGSGAGPGRRALTQAATSRPAAASSSRVCPTPGKSSGLGRLLSTAWASARSRATRRSIAQDCGEPAGVRQGGARAAPHHTHNPAGLGPHRRPRRVPLLADRAVLGPPAQRLFFLRDKSWGDAGPPGQGHWSTGDVEDSWAWISGSGRWCFSCPAPGCALMSERSCNAHAFPVRSLRLDVELSPPGGGAPL